MEHHKNIVERGLIPTLIAAGVTMEEDGLDGKPVNRAKYTGLHALRHFYASWCINRRLDGGLELPGKVGLKSGPELGSFETKPTKTGSYTLEPT